tara:strand:+ start:6300 stop:8306 length:2007 start_codon:yes stop_codon:yes gene_type:complete
MDTRETSYNTRSSKTGRQMYYKNCDNCDNQLAISAKVIKHMAEVTQLNIEYHINCDKCKTQLNIAASQFMDGNNLHNNHNSGHITNVATNAATNAATNKCSANIPETLPKRTRTISCSKSDTSPKLIIHNIPDSDQESVDESNDDSEDETKDVPPEKQLLNMLVDIANNNLTEITSGDMSDWEEEPFEGLHKDIHYTEDERNYVRNLDPDQRKSIINVENNLYDILKTETPLRFKILNSDMPDRSKSNLLSKMDHYYTLDPSDNEYQKLSPWINQLDKIPFGKYVPNRVTKTTPVSEIQAYLSDTKKIMDAAVYGHDVAKTQIISAIAREISNPSTIGNCFAIQGPMGNGKTTLIKEGVCKAMGRPFGFITLGGMQDSSYLLGHEITYEGSKCGRIVEILGEADCMNPVIFFDELDKLSDTPKGEEISNLLCHLTDSSQNKEFHDKYFSGIDFDLSRATLIFSYNDESNINPILLDRMHRIKTSGFDKPDKTKIAQDYLIPSLLKEFSLQPSDITFEDAAIHTLIDTHCNNEKGVRNLKRNVETIIAKLNVMRYLIPEKVDISLSECSDGDNVSAAITGLLTQLVEEVIITEKASAVVQGEELDRTASVEETCINKDAISPQETSINVKDIVNYEIANFKLPYNVTGSDLNFFLDKTSKSTAYEHMYM